MIRHATWEDFEAVYEMCREFWAAGGPLPEFDERHTRSKLEHLFNSCPVLVAADSNDVPVGMLILVFVEHLCAPLVNCGELAWYVKPEHRRSGAGVRLLEEGMKIAKAEGATTMALVYMQSSMPDVVKSLYESMGFVESERTYLKRL